MKLIELLALLESISKQAETAQDFAKQNDMETVLIYLDNIEEDINKAKHLAEAVR